VTEDWQNQGCLHWQGFTPRINKPPDILCHSTMVKFCRADMTRCFQLGNAGSKSSVVAETLLANCCQLSAGVCCAELGRRRVRGDGRDTGPTQIMIHKLPMQAWPFSTARGGCEEVKTQYFYTVTNHVGSKTEPKAPYTHLLWLILLLLHRKK